VYLLQRPHPISWPIHSADRSAAIVVLRTTARVPVDHPDRLHYTQ